MKYPYWLQVTDKVKFTDSKFFRIRVNPKWVDDKPMLEHEKVHVKQWYMSLFCGIAAFIVLYLFGYPNLAIAGLVAGITGKELLYIFVPSVRLFLEIQAYRKQLSYVENPDYDHYAKVIVDYYNVKATKEEVKELLINGE